MTPHDQTQMREALQAIAKKAEALWFESEYPHVFAYQEIQEMAEQALTAQADAGINEQLLEALKHLYHNARKSGANMGLALNVADSAIRAAEAAKGGV